MKPPEEVFAGTDSLKGMARPAKGTYSGESFLSRLAAYIAASACAKRAARSRGSSPGVQETTPALKPKEQGRNFIFSSRIF